MIREKNVAAPVRFSVAWTVEYVDAAGNPVSREVIAPGIPVTVHYFREGDRMLVDRVTVQRKPARSALATTETTTTTTITGREAREVEKLCGRIAHEERKLAEHPDRTHLQDEIDRNRAALEAIGRSQ